MTEDQILYSYYGPIFFFLYITEDMLRQYCKKVGIGFEETMLNWENTPNMQVFQDWMPWFEGVLTSKVSQK